MARPRGRTQHLRAVCDLKRLKEYWTRLMPDVSPFLYKFYRFTALRHMRPCAKSIFGGLLVGHRDQSLLRVLAQDQAAEANLLRHFVAVMLQADGAGDAGFGLGILPVGNQRAVHGQADARSDGENLHLVPVAVVGLLGSAVVAVN